MQYHLLSPVLIISISFSIVKPVRLPNRLPPPGIERQHRGRDRDAITFMDDDEHFLDVPLILIDT